MNGGTGQAPRLIVGVSRSRASWWALAWAVGEARRREARLLVVHVFRPPLAAPADYNSGFLGVSRDPYAERMAHGNALIRTAIAEAVGSIPDDVAVEQQVVPGRPAAKLARLARGDDLLVLGSRRRGLFRRFAPGSVGRACARRADCPVVAVPEPSARALAPTVTAGSARGHWHRWVPGHGAPAAS